ncbi:FxSxx-COOH system tetratricopeptide repeat protein [Nonomuraea sp. NPDC049152]|uniref:FxSxx-COOH system tetratricopeptide repeat protein n=1 Tax=Nonomuraea sp. NPDC049152 TaxID=3154350 RepID=UPI0033E662F7
MSEGRIITFYSYKGGTGRTMALANVAWILAANGRKVLALDWDLESPGLHRFFHPFLDAGVISATPGVIELITDYAFAALQPVERAPDWHLEYTQVLPRAVSLEYDHFPGSGTIDFISAGRQNRDYSSLLSTFDWDNFYERLGGGVFLDALRADMRRHYDYVLIDSRTGLSDIADICTVHFPDTLVDCFTLSDQSIDGAAAVARHIDQRYRDRGIRILPVPMRIESGEKKKLDAGRALARRRFAGFPKGANAEEYWATIEIPYVPFYAYEETLATFGEVATSPSSILAAYERLTSALTDGDVSGLPPVTDEVRAHVLSLFERRPPDLEEEGTLALSYVPEDRMWADWVAALLRRSGMKVVVVSADLPEWEQTLSGAARVAALVSPAYQRSPRTRHFLDEQPSYVAIRVGDLPTEEGVRIDRLVESEAAQVLLQVFGRTGQAPEHPAEPAPIGPRYPGTPPRVWNLPPRNAAFTGRAAVLEELRNQLVGTGQAVVLPMALYGLGGVGKTQVALEYAYRFMADYDLVWWVSAEEPAGISDNFLDELAPRLGIKPEEATVKAVLESLRRGEPYQRWLLIFDNATELAELADHLPVGAAGHVLITSRNPAWSSVAAPLEVDVFSRDESVEHLRGQVQGLPESDAEKVATALGFLPLAVDQAGAWLRETGMPAGDYVELLESELTRALPTFRGPKPVAATWNVSLEQLMRRSPAAVRLLQLCAFFSADPISMTMIYSDEMVRLLREHDDSLREKLMLGSVIREISRFALARVDQSDNTIQVHRLVQAVIRSQMDDEAQTRACHDVHTVLVGARPRQGDVDDPENWPRYSLIWPHLTASRAAECGDEDTRQLLIDSVRYSWKRGNFDRALERGRQLERAWLDAHGRDHWQTLYLRFHLANVLRSQGRYKAAKEEDEQVVAMQRTTLGERHPHTLMTSGSLAADLRGLGEFRQALTLDQNTYAQFKELFGEEHPRTLAAANNLAVSYRLVGDCFSARRIDQETLERRKAVLGAAHPYTLFSQANLARDHREAGQFQLSVELLRDTLEKYKDVLGDDFLDTLRTAKSLAVSLRKAGEQTEALELAKETYDRYVLHYPASPETRAAELEYACCLSALDDKPQARRIATGILADFRASLGATHPYTLVVANNLITYLRGTGDVREAYELGEETMEAFRVRLAADHPFALSCAVNHANCLGDLGDLAAAETLERDTAALLKSVLGPLHPDTLACRANLAITLHSTGQQREVIGLMRDVLGGDHPNIESLREWRRINRDLEPQPT